MARNNIFGYNVENWISEDDLKGMKYAAYWNDEEEEKRKEWYVCGNSFSKMDCYLDKSALPYDLRNVIDVLKADFGRQIKGVGIDLAAGNLWAVPYLIEYGEVKKLYCLEYSFHRLLKIGPHVLRHYRIAGERVTLVLGSFYKLHLDDASIDFAFLSQAFHHADKPLLLLQEIKRVLKPDGTVIMIGEHITSYLKLYSKHIIKYLISRTLPHKLQELLFKRIFSVKRLFPKSSQELRPPDPVTGDHYYTEGDYKSFFSEIGFSYKHIKSTSAGHDAFLLFNKVNA